jgi:hypothetical protein
MNIEAFAPSATSDPMRGATGDPAATGDVVVVSDDVGADTFTRAAAFDPSSIPVPVDLLVYTPAEFERLRRDTGGLGAVLRNECRWVRVRP